MYITSLYKEGALEPLPKEGEVGGELTLVLELFKLPEIVILLVNFAVPPIPILLFITPLPVTKP